MSKHPPKDSGPQLFWDTTSYIIWTLAAKSFDIAFSFSYDLHWIKKAYYINRGPYPATQWLEDLRTLHDCVSSSLFTLLPTRFTLVGGLCVRRKVKEVLKLLLIVRTRNLYVPLSSLKGARLEIDLVINDYDLKWIILYSPHPSARYFEDLNGL